MNEINETQNNSENIVISQSVAILIDGNNIETKYSCRSK